MVEFGDLEPLRAESMDESCEHGGAGFIDGERPAGGIVFGPVIESVGSEVGSAGGGRVPGKAHVRLTRWNSIAFVALFCKASRERSSKRLGRRY
jgi:hypothetical protein